ncbi:MAG: tryptophan synthase subunit alpha [Saprospiraceae bacterium]|nr:tryptophan synthase subunit alpha [Saprospiraceae bacterium]
MNSAPNKTILNLYLTAGYPDQATSRTLLQALLDHPEVDMIELGMPYSDPLADGPVIQHASQVALESGMTMSGYFELLGSVHNRRQIPVIFMGYFNNVLQYGVEQFVKHGVSCGMDSCIIPDLPPEVFQHDYQSLFADAGTGLNFLVTPQSTDRAIRLADALSHRFIYLVSAGSTTGNTTTDRKHLSEYLRRIDAMQLKSSRLVGFGISGHEEYRVASEYADGVIIGSALLRHLAARQFDPSSIHAFIQTIRYDHTT